MKTPFAPLWAIAAVAAISSAPAFAGREDGSCLELFELVNQQPTSATFGQAVRSSAYRELPTVVMLLSAG